MNTQLKQLLEQFREVTFHAEFNNRCLDDHLEESFYTMQLEINRLYNQLQDYLGFIDVANWRREDLESYCPEHIDAHEFTEAVKNKLESDFDASIGVNWRTIEQAATSVIEELNNFGEL
jgi:hypothetical protein